MDFDNNDEEQQQQMAAAQQMEAGHHGQDDEFEGYDQENMEMFQQQEQNFYADEMHQ